MAARATLTRADAFRIGCLDAHGQTALVQSGDIDATGLAEAATLRIEALEPQLQALGHRAFALARREAAVLDGAAGGASCRSPMAGVPWLPKDSRDYPGMPTRSCSPGRSGVLAERGFPCVQRLIAQGLVAVGKSAIRAFGLLAPTEPVRGPVTRNPWSPARSPGGSNGGDARALLGGHRLADALEPWTLGTFAPVLPVEPLRRTMVEWIDHTPLQNMADTPAIALSPGHDLDGQPIGSRSAADRGQEDVLLALAYEVEAASPWAGHWPAHSAAACAAA